jgi:membrane-bound metal-dependent hydrolase YbcI (DUF457 family)
MFIFAHVFCGALIGLGFWHLTNDRRALPLCILGAILPDLLDKSSALLFPGVLGSGRTICHSLVFFAIVLLFGILLWQYRHTLLGIAFACAILSHQIMDAMWNMASTWFYPLLGAFPTYMIPNYVGHYFWLEISSPSEWVFGCASLLIIAAWYLSIPEHHATCLTPRWRNTGRFVAVCLLGVMGVYLLFFGLGALPGAVFAPTYDPVTDLMAGIIALCGTIVLLKWQTFPVQQ